ncbi:MAG: tetratricopeptide repeat protein [Bryobacteraceae bacterium]
MTIWQHRGRRAFGLCALFLFTAAAQTPEQAEIFSKARQAMSEGRFNDAVPFYLDLVKSAPGNPGLLLNLGMALHLAGRDAEAITELNRVLKPQPAACPALVMTGLS